LTWQTSKFDAFLLYHEVWDAFYLSNVDMSPYLSTVQRRIHQNWLPSQELSSLTSKYTLVISRTGALLNYRLKRSSGNALFEELATAAITATTFPPLPIECRGEYITIDFYFDYEKK
jgi:outer membrane biosynthesis protein TonB